MKGINKVQLLGNIGEIYERKVMESGDSVIVKSVKNRGSGLKSMLEYYQIIQW
ncbi:hypothetical protein [Suttonella ornithocola]|uniref:Uncharacterized protein n=1 Tax=Suttonella ornithocola TaxID=279832 RepID=A0A380MV35_9GAMM|nr:hypothetical protein [Suttonella ornithocola]SUO96158.1 Uncharacterised protein [Suttonella ornithocola]